MKFDYIIQWHSVAEEKLLNQAQYILQQSQNVLIAEHFYDAVKRNRQAFLHSGCLPIQKEKRNFNIEWQIRR